MSNFTVDMARATPGNQLLLDTIVGNISRQIKHHFKNTSIIMALEMNSGSYAFFLYICGMIPTEQNANLIQFQLELDRESHDNETNHAGAKNVRNSVVEVRRPRTEFPMHDS